MAEVLAVVCLDTGDRVEQMFIYAGDNIEMLAKYFCYRHTIRPEGEQYIVQEIKAQLNNTTPLVQSKNITQVNSPNASKAVSPHKKSPSLISRNSQLLVKNLQRNQNDLDIHSYLYDEAWKQQQRRDQMQEDHLKKNEFKHIPEISKRSRDIAIQRSKSDNVLKRQSPRDASQKQQRLKDIFDEKYPFMPNKNKRARWDTSREQQQAQADRLTKVKSNRDFRMIPRSTSPIEILNQFKPKITKDAIYQKVKKRDQENDLRIAQEILMNQQNRTLLRKRRQ